MTDIRDVLEMVDTAMSVIKKVADTPGVSMIPYVSTISNAIGLMKVGIKAGVDIAEYVQAVSNTFTGLVPTQSDLDMLDAKLAELRAKVHAPLPDKEEGEKD